jgi:outer membrane protein assembly factor BamB/PKD repeat protein
LTGKDSLYCFWSKPGEYKVYVNMVDAGGTVWADSDSVCIIQDIPQVGILGKITAAINTPLTLSTKITQKFGTIVKYQWDNGIIPGQYIIGDSTYTVKYLKEGQYTVTVLVTDDDGNTNSNTHGVIVTNDAPTIAGLNDTIISIKDTVLFSISAHDTNGILQKYYWNFGDGSTKQFDTTKSPSDSHVFPSIAMQCTVSVSVADSFGKLGSRKAVVTVLQDVPVPSAGKDTIVAINSSVPFKGSATQLFGSIVMYKWDYDGDGIYDDSSTITGAATHTYTHEAVFNAKLLVRDDDGNEATTIRHVTVQNSAPIISSIRTDTTISIKDSIQLFGTAHDVDGTIKEYAWDFNGDGTYEYASTAQVNAGYKYNIAGIYKAVLRVTDDDNKKNYDTVKITVLQDIPIPNAGKDTTVSIKDTIRLHGSATQQFGTITEWAWDIGNTGTFKVTSKSDTIIIAPATENLNYLCVLKVTDDDGNVAKDTVKVTIMQDVPVANAGIDTAVGINASIPFKGTATQQFGSIVMYKWDYDGDGIYDDSSITTGASAHIYSHEAVYNAKLLVRDDDGNEATAIRRVTVQNSAPIISSIRTDTTISIKDSIQLFGAAHDVDGTIKEYAWDFNGDGIYEYANVAQVNAGYRYNIAGIYKAVLRVTDDDNKKSYDTVKITVLQDIPIPNAGKDTTASIKDTIRLHGSATQQFGTITEWAWDIGNTGTFKVTSKGDTIIIAPSAENLNYLCVLRVTDDDGNVAKDTVKVTVMQDVPVANAGTDQTLLITDTIRLHGTETQQFGYIAKWEWDIGGTGIFISTSKSDTAFIKSAPADSNFICILRVTDDDGNVSNPDTVKIKRLLRYEKWVFTAGSSVISSPAIGSDGTIYIESADYKLYAINPDGSKKWEFLTGSYNYSSPAIGPDGTIYAGSGDNKLYAVNPDGTKKWEFLSSNEIQSSPAIGFDGTIYVGSADHKFYALNPDGTKKWQLATSNNFESSPAVASDGTIYVGNDNYYFYSLSSDGTVKWQFATGYIILSSPAIGTDGTIFVGSDDHKLYALNSDGTVKWQFVAGDVVSSSPVIGADGTIYVGSNDQKLYAMNSNGTKKWEFATGDVVFSSPAIGADGTIFVGSGDQNIYAINPDGTLQWKLNIGSLLFFSRPAIGSDGTIYVGSQDGKLHSIATTCKGLASSPWPMFHHDIKHTGRVQ